MFRNKKDFVTHIPQETKIEVANGDSMMSKSVGTVSGKHLGSPLSLRNTLHVPDLQCNLVSLVQLAKKGCSLSFLDEGRFEVTQNNEVVLCQETLLMA